MKTKSVWRELGLVIVALALGAGLAACGPKKASESEGKANAAPAAPASAEKADHAVATPSAAQPAASPARSALPVVSAAPAWSLVSAADGRVVTSAEFKGKIVVVDFWATWCPPCVGEVPGYIALQKKYADKGVVVLGFSVDQDGPDVVNAFAKAKGVNYPLLMADEAVIAAFGGLEGVPTTFLIDREGNIRHKKVGSMAHDDYEALVASLVEVE